MKLLIMRHAKSAFALNGFSDHERPLSDSGRLVVPQIAQKVVELHCEPEVIYCSDAQRTSETLELFVPELTKKPQVEFSHDLYQASIQDLIHFIENKNLLCDTLQIIGHNPTLEALVKYLSGEYRDIQPGNLVILTHDDTTWDRALNQKGSWQLTEFLSTT
ncbi:MAG: histidine phosphatase family protein [Myxococcaceae bacterium]